MVFAKNFLRKISPKNSSKSVIDGYKLGFPRESIKEQEPDSPLPVIDENIPRAPAGKRRFLDIVIANKIR